MEIMVPGSLFTTLTYSFNNMMRSSGYPTKAMLVLLTGAVMNTLLAPLFIFVFHWGIRGAAIATVLSMMTTAVMVMHHYFSESSYLRFRRQHMKLDRSRFGIHQYRILRFPGYQLQKPENQKL